MGHIMSGAGVEEEFTTEEFRALVLLARRALYADLNTRRALQRHGINIVPANFYSEIPTLDELDASFEFREPNGPYNSPKVFDPNRLTSVLQELDAYADEFDPPREGDVGAPAGFFWQNPAFSYSDAMAYYCVLRHFKPRQVIEVGSGFSTFVALQALEKNGAGSVSCIEPFPRDWFRKVQDRVTLHERRVQDLAPDFFQTHLNSGDVLFIDSTHTVKAGSDCLHLYLRVLPELTHRVHVHAHDIFLPFPLPKQNAETHIYWTEQYLLYAYLLQNPFCKVIFSSQYHHSFNRPALNRFMRGRYGSGGGSIWLTLKGP
jgi:hypothetical protein